jgi:hypothetical protein
MIGTASPFFPNPRHSRTNEHSVRIAAYAGSNAS